MEGGWQWFPPPEDGQGAPKAAEDGQGARPGRLRQPSGEGGHLRGTDEPERSAEGGRGDGPCPRCGTPRFTAGPPDTPCAACLTTDEQEML